MSRRHGGPAKRKPPYEDALGQGRPKPKIKPAERAPGKAGPKAKRNADKAGDAKRNARTDAGATPNRKARRHADGVGKARPPGKPKPPTARPPAREQPRSEGLVATVDKRGRFLVAEPFFSPGRRMVLDRDSRTKVGDLVLVRAATRAGGHAKVVRGLGRPDVASDVLEALMLDRGLRRRFDPAVERAAKQARDHGVDPEVARRDLTDLPTFTIDPATARDFDDAISAQRIDEADGGGTRIWVHIADVSAYVRPGSLIDREAARRATSVYVPGRVEPMLPEPLSNDACSLVPRQRRAAVTVQLDYDGTEVVRAQFYRSTIRSDARLDYEQVDRVFAGDEEAAEPWATPLGAARAVAAGLHERRLRQDALELETSEPEFAFDRGGHVAESRPSEQTESHRLVEHLMIAANEQVAKLLSERGVPSLYRVHEQPDGDSALRLVEQLASLGVATPPVREQMAPSEAAEAIAACSRAVAQHATRTGHGRDALTFLVLRSLKQAYYSPKPLGHAGLGLTHYAHFTSPIRRYPDLVAHRALLSAVNAGEQAPRSSELEETGVWSSARERDAMQLERMADRVARAFLLERTLFQGGWDQRFDGEVTGLIGAGAFVRFGGGHEGLLPVRRLRGDWWELNEQGTMLTGERTGETIRLGDPVRVQVERVETARGRVDLVPAELPEA
ncbi:MAG: RNB domain-containing ribonuclease [Solirubrobacteraceae bacterium]|nr:RNB domain-containing ribonuclease [Solirubrobacteraceae bacterium]